MYRRLAEVRTDADVDAIREELDDRYGEPPVEVASLLLVARFRARARRAGITEVTIAGRNVRFAPVVDLPESRVLRLNRLYPRSIVKSQVGTLLVPRPQRESTRTDSTANVIGGRPIDGVALLEWARTVIDSVIDPDRAESSQTSTSSRESS
jgi:transcription-repair coupling factor (superfamily II helicase)